MKKLGFTFFLLLLFLAMVLSWLFVIFPEKQMQINEFFEEYSSFFREMRIFINEVTNNSLGNDSESVNIPVSEEMQLFYEVYKKEYEEIMNFNYNFPKDDIKKDYPIAIILRNMGIGKHEMILIKSNEYIDVNSFLVSPQNSMIVGKVINATGKTATVIPFWNENFSCQIKIESSDGRVEDLALLEKREAVSFNPSILFKKNDMVYVSEYESGAYSLKRYGWDRLGKILSLKDRDILEHYTIDFISTRKEIMDNRYFLLVK